jgi:hypothetical protein
MSQENTQQLLIDSQESSSQGDYLPKRKIQHLESPESPKPSDVDELVEALFTSSQIASTSEEKMEASQGKPTPDVANVDNAADEIKRFEQEKIIRENKDKRKCCYIDAFLEVCKKLEEVDERY